MNDHGDRWDSGGKHRGERKPLAFQAALKGFLDRVCGKSPHKDWSGTPLDDDNCPGCGRPSAIPGQWCQRCIDANKSQFTGTDHYAWRVPDCPDDAPDGTCWDCGAPRNRRHLESCPTQQAGEAL